MRSPSPSLPAGTPTRAIALLALGGFAGQAMVRASDTLLPQISSNLDVSIGAASLVVTMYALAHGTIQLVVGPIGDRFGKYRMVALACAMSAVTVAACGLAQSLTSLALARIASGMTAAWVIPLGIAFIGDVVPYERRQQVLGRYLSGQLMGQLFGQAAGGIIGDLLGWRAVFFALAGLYAIAAIGLLRELAVNPLPLAVVSGGKQRGLFANYAIVLKTPWARTVCLAVFLESAFMFGAFAYVGADLHVRFDLDFTWIGLMIGSFAIGGLIYAVNVQGFVSWLDQPGLALWGGLLLAGAFLLLAAGCPLWAVPIAIGIIGLGFYMFHNTLQTNATQMCPDARGTAVGLFAACIYIGQSLGVAAAAPVVDRAGTPAVFATASVLIAGLAVWTYVRLTRRRAADAI